MTTSGICELFRFAPPQRRKHGSAGITSGWKVACALLLLCAATAIASPAQTFRTLVNFNGANGSYPQSSLVQGLDGNFYGTTVMGGDLTCYPPNGCGTVFKVTRSGKLTTLYAFRSQNNYDAIDGAVPMAELVQSPDGNFYGTTSAWRGQRVGGGTVFMITPGGVLTTLYSFCAQTKLH